MSAPTFEDIFHDGMAQVRDALASAPGAAREEAQEVLDSDELVKKVVDIVTPVMDERFRKKYYRNMIIGVGVLLAIFGVTILIAFNQIASVAAVNAATNTDQDAAIARSEQTISAFRAQLDAANVVLVGLGLDPIDAPQNPEPGSVGQAELINAAATATTLASLPREVFVNPDPSVIAQAVASYMLANPINVDPQLVINAVADYFAANQEQFRGLSGTNGVDGGEGPQGPPPSAEQIQAAFRDEVAANPQLLCPLGGTYGDRTIALANGGSTVQFGCFANDTAPPDNGGVLDPGEEVAPGNTGEGGAATPSPTPGGTEDPTLAPQPSGEPSADPPVPTPTPTEPDVLDDLLGVG